MESKPKFKLEVWGHFGERCRWTLRSKLKEGFIQIENISNTYLGEQSAERAARRIAKKLDVEVHKGNYA